LTQGKAFFAMLSLKRYIVCDVETSGLSPRHGGRVIEIGAVACEDGQIVEEFGTLINVDCSIHWAAERVHGISRRMLAGMPEPEEVWRAFQSFIGGCPVVAHNATFDAAFLRHEMTMLGMHMNNRFFCSLALSRKCLPHLPNHRLATVAQHLLGALPPTIRLHRALYDARLAAKIWMALDR